MSRFTPYFLNSNFPARHDLNDSTKLFPAIFGNTGNPYITHAMLRYLGTDWRYLTEENSLSCMFHTRLTPEEGARISRDFTCIFMTTQDYVRADWPEVYFANALHNLELIQLPVIAFSLGANSFGGNDADLAQKLNPTHAKFLYTLAERCKTIAVRGDFTQQTLANMGIHNTVVTGCPTFYLHGADRQFTKKPWDEEKMIGATGGFAHLDRKQLHYYWQDELLFAKILYFSDDYTEDDFTHYSIHFFSNPKYQPYIYSTLDAVREQRASLFLDMQAWEEDIAARTNMVIGTRVHGAIAALNAGVPAIVLNNDARATEMCALFGIPHYPDGVVSNVSLKDMHARYDYAPMQHRYAALYQRWSEWATSHDLTPGMLRDAPIDTHAAVTALKLNAPAIRQARFERIQTVAEQSQQPLTLPEIVPETTEEPACEIPAGTLMEEEEFLCASEPPPVLIARPFSSRKAIADIAGALHNWRLWGFVGWNDIRQRYRRSTFGPFWLTISLAVMVFAIGTLYSQIMHVDIQTYLPFFCVSILSWTFIATSLNECCNAYIAAEGLIKQIALPYSVHVLRVIWRNFIVFLHHLMIYVLVAFLFQVPVGFSLLLLIPGVALLLLNLLWVGLVIAMICARFRDVPQIVMNVLQVMIFFTPILWQPTHLEGNMQLLIHLNPFYHLIELLRAPMLGYYADNRTWLVGIGMMLLGYGFTILLYRRYRQRISYWV